MATKVEYIDNGVLSTTLDRIKKSKVTWLIIGYLAVKAEEHFPIAAFESVGAFKGAIGAYLPHLLGGSAGILIRAAAMKAELATNALNPGISNVAAIEVPAEDSKAKVRGGVLSGLMAMVLGVLVIPGCGTTTASGKYCYTDPNGNQVCVESKETALTELNQIMFPPPEPAAPPLSGVVSQAGPVPAAGFQAFIGNKPVEK